MDSAAEIGAVRNEAIQTEADTNAIASKVSVQTADLELRRRPATGSGSTKR